MNTKRNPPSPFAVHTLDDVHKYEHKESEYVHKYEHKEKGHVQQREYREKEGQSPSIRT